MKTLKTLLIAAGLSTSLLSTAFADGSTDYETPLNPLDPVRVISPLTLVRGDGVKVGEGTAIYPQVGLETGFVSNTFYTAEDQIPAGILRLLIEVGAGSLSESRLRQAEKENVDLGSFIYSLDAYAAYDQYLSTNGKVTSQGGLGFGINAQGMANPNKPIYFGVQEQFDRILRAANFESRTNANRDINTLKLRLGIQPTDSSLGGTITYTNQVDVFEEDSESFANRMKNMLAARLNWRFFPKTTAFLEVNQSFNFGLGSDSKKVDSYPLQAYVGLSSALTLKTAAVVQAGYTQGIYSSGPDYKSPLFGAFLEHRYSEYGSLRLRYGYEHNDSINANFYRDHVIQASLTHRFVPFALFLSPEVRFREYEGSIGPLMGPSVRDDIIIAAAAGLRYQFRNWMTAAAEYRVVSDQTDYRYTGPSAMIDPSYVRHELFAGIRVAY